jgi:hypothetical protein
LTMSEYESLLTRIDDVREKVESVSYTLAAHVAVEAAVSARRSSWVPILAAGGAWVAALAALAATIWR